MGSLNVNVEEKKLVITLPESVKETNARAIETELFEILGLNVGLPVVIDCSELKYISSSGLRVLLKAQKSLGKGEQITLKNVSREVNEILDMTGFSDIFRVIKKLKRMSIEGRKRISSGVNGAFYRLDHDMMLKVFRPGTTIDEVQDERSLAKKALTAGIPTAISFSVAQVEDDQYGIVYEEIRGYTLANTLKADPSQTVSLAKKLGELVRELHSTDVSSSGLPDIKARYRSWIEQARRRNPSFEVRQLEALVESMANKQTFLHGDINLNSVFVTKEGFLLVDMGSCGYGHPIFDLQGLYASLYAIENDRPGYCMENFGIPADRCEHFWKCFIMSYLDGNDPTMDTSNLSDINKETLNQLLTKYYVLKAKLIDSLA